ncbi:hypothetical protein QL285_057460 [Trifolium repens]|nr:hypothetical protein QL285_057460 [Trifolium repens]
MATPSFTSYIRIIRKETKSFETCIHPHQRKIQICLRFKSGWIKELRKDFFGLMRREDGQSIRVALLLHEDNCYMTDDMLASAFLGLQEPTRVLLTYEIYDNCFKVSILKDESVASNDTSQSSYQSLETVNYECGCDDPMLEDTDNKQAL